MANENTNQDIKVSVIIPIYNASETISRCLDSLLMQTLKELEIICVLDCPTDGTEKVVESYVLRDSRIRMISNDKNSGVAETRNRGLQSAKGEYIGFSDHDDWHEPDMFQSLYEKAIAEHADIVFSDTFVEQENTSTIIKYTVPTKKEILKSIILPEHSKVSKNRLAKSVWSSIYKRELMEQCGARFYDRKIFLEEDTFFNLRMFVSTEKISYLNRSLYHWNLTREAVSVQYDGFFRISGIAKLYHALFDTLNSGCKPVFTQREVLEIKKRLLSSYFFSNMYSYTKEGYDEIVNQLGKDCRNISVCYTDNEFSPVMIPRLMTFGLFILRLKLQYYFKLR